jgi:soluble lytic murein transglycosylase
LGADSAHLSASEPGKGDSLRTLLRLMLDRTRSGGPAMARASARELLPQNAQRIAAALQHARASAELVIDDPVQLRSRCLELLAPLATAHGEAYPWLPRAAELIELERFDEASEEISEAYLAWREASGLPRLRWGLVSLWTGEAVRRPLNPPLRRARIALEPEARIQLGEVATLLGDPSIAFDLGSADETEPHAYAGLVEAAARKYGLEPELLFAVMRVESAFNHRVQSSAGAIGLMQIMPRTGSRIAVRLGVKDFEPSQLLQPARNIEFSAWYLASLLQRFDGRLPLAIASYNGGPHNVRNWMRNNSPDMPLDAFLERIPFKETHGYVRKVLSFYALYRAQKALPAPELSVVLPHLAPDDVAF